MSKSTQTIALRLENWARWARVPKEQGKSMTAIYCDALRKARTGSIYDEPQVPLPPIDEDDAELIERSVAVMRPDSREFLRRLYVFRATHGFMCRRFGIRHRPMSVFDLHRQRIEQELQNSLDVADRPGNDSRRRPNQRTLRPATKGGTVSKATEDVD
jgi:hypothetical protein